MTGYIGFENDKKNWLAWLIKFFTESKWCHSFIMFSNDLVFESNIKNELTPFDKKIKDVKKGRKELELYKFKYLSNVTLDVDMIHYVNEHFGKRYGFLQLVGFVPVVIIKKLFGINIKNPFTGGDICSELVLRWINKYYNEEFKELDINTTSPEDIYKKIVKSDNFELFQSYK